MADKAVQSGGATGRLKGSRALALGLTAAMLLAGCSGEETPAQPPITTTPPPAPPASPPPPPPAPPPVAASVEREIRPDTANPAVTQNLSPHFVVNPDPSAAPAGRLFVMLPGTGAVARTYEDIVRVGASVGYHAIGLTYPNDDAVAVSCSGSPDPDCAEDIRQETITGLASSVLVVVDEANSIDGRLLSLLEFLDAAFPAEGWGQFLDNGAIDWSLVSVAGHSQGGGHAGFMAKLRELHRVSMFSGPSDPSPTPGTAAAWTFLPNITPVERQFGFIHTADNLASPITVFRSWQAIGLDIFGYSVSVDGAAPPYQNTHLLMTSAPPNPVPTGPSASPTHGAPVVDAVTPRGPGGVPIYRPVWIYMAFP